MAGVTTYLNLHGRIAYEVDPQVGGGVYTWPIYVEFSDQSDPLLVALLARVRGQLAERVAREGPGDVPLG